MRDEYTVQGSFKSSNEVRRLGSIFGHTGGSFAGLVYDPSGIAPTVNTAQGGLRMPLILEVDNDTDNG